MNNVYLNDLIFALVGSTELVKSWWTTPNRGFDMQCPCDVDETKIKRYLESFCFK